VAPGGGPTTVAEIRELLCVSELMRIQASLTAAIARVHRILAARPR
jgi:hypothetical protein